MRTFIGVIVDRFRKRVVYRIFFPFCVIIIVGVSIALPYGVQTTTRIMEDRADAQVLSVANVVSNIIRNELDKLLTFCELKIYSAPVQDAVNQRDIPLLRQLIIPIKARSRVDVVVIFDRDGNELIRFDERHILGEHLKDLRIVRNGLSGMSYQDVITTPSRIIFCAIAPNESAKSKGGINGAMLVGQVMDDRLVSQIKETTGIDLVISNTEGSIMASTLRDRQEIAALLDLRQVASSLKSRTGILLTFFIDGVPYRAADQLFLIHQEPRAIISVIMDISASYRTTRNVITVMILLLLSGVVAAVLCSLWIARSISRPIENLSLATEGMAAGDLSQRISEITPDEIGRLSTSFNAMIERIAQDMREIRKERNKAQSYSAELEMFNRELKKARTELVQASKMVAMGQLGASIAHELNQPLLAIGLFAEQTLKYMQKGTPEHLCLERIIGQANRMSEIVNEIRLFARQSLLEPKEIDIGEPIRKALALVDRQLADANIEVTYHPAEGLPRVLADDNQLQQVFLNLITNARDAILPKGKGRIAITVTPCADRQFLSLEFSDDGVGIDPELLNEIFMPFFTTKRETRGLGLGLSISYGIIHRHRGIIDVHSVPGRGTTFRILLPTILVKECWDVIECERCRPGTTRDQCPVFTKDQGLFCWMYFQRSGDEEQVSVHCEKCPLLLTRRPVVQQGGENAG